ncbi:MAG: hypothetical protein JW810_01140 [Sedimentisphaerales bacterium]|nr:hypothetical protein [Sedimentisphaerales bacterium]
MELTGPHRCRRRSGRPGFTLLEILATFVLVAVIIPVAMKGLGMVIRLADRSVQQVEACSLAETKLAELLVTQEYLSGPQSGDFGSEWPAYRWNLQVVDWGEASLKQVSIRVVWQDVLREHEIVLDTLVYPQE